MQSLSELPYGAVELPAITYRGKVYRDCQCYKQHKTHRTKIKCALPYARGFSGDGEYAVISRCRGWAVALFDSEEAAVKAANYGCGGRCKYDHEVIRIEL